MKIQRSSFRTIALLTGISCAMFLSACGSSGSGGTESVSSAQSERAGDFSSAEVGGEIPANGTRPVESLCKPGTFVKTTTLSDSCPSNQFDIFEDNGFYAARGFADKDYYFWEALTETFEAPSFVTNNLVLLEVPVNGFEQSLCSFFCSEDGQTISVSCIERGVPVCQETFYTRVASAPTDANGQTAVDPAAGASGSGQCESASGSYVLDHVSCNPGVTISGSQLGGEQVLEVNSADDLNNVTAVLTEQNFLPGTTSEAHYECPADGSEVHIISHATSNGFSVTCDYVYLR